MVRERNSILKDIGIDWVQKRRKSFEERGMRRKYYIVLQWVVYRVVFSRIEQLKSQNRVAITATTQYSSLSKPTLLGIGRCRSNVSTPSVNQNSSAGKIIGRLLEFQLKESTVFKFSLEISASPPS